jgi:hypothetical protein
LHSLRRGGVEHFEDAVNVKFHLSSSLDESEKIAAAMRCNAFRHGETRAKGITPCSAGITLLEAVSAAAKRAEPGDVALLSPACLSFRFVPDFPAQDRFASDSFEGRRRGKNLDTKTSRKTRLWAK